MNGEGGSMEEVKRERKRIESKRVVEEVKGRQRTKGWYRRERVW